jgi:hypothetical protein
MTRITQAPIDRKQYLDKRNWEGSCYELAIEYYPGGNDVRLYNAVNAIWNLNALSGPWLHPDGFLGTDRMPESLDEASHLYGLLKITQSRAVGCYTTTVREKDDSDWLKFCLPVSMLSLFYNVQEPLAQYNNPWLREIDDIFIRLAQLVYDYYPFNLAIVGADIGSELTERNLSLSDVKSGGFFIPPILYERLRMNIEGQILPGGLRWTPPTT